MAWGRGRRNSLTFLKKLFLSVRFSYLSTVAQNKSAAQDYEGAMKILENMHRIFNINIPSSRVPVEVNLLTAFALLGIGDTARLSEMVTIIHDQLKRSDSYSIYD